MILLGIGVLLRFSKFLNKSASAISIYFRRFAKSTAILPTGFAVFSSDLAVRLRPLIQASSHRVGVRHDTVDELAELERWVLRACIDRFRRFVALHWDALRFSRLS